MDFKTQKVAAAIKVSIEMCIFFFLIYVSMHVFSWYYGTYVNPI